MQVKYNMVVDFARPNKSNTILVAEDDANSRKVTFTLLFDKAPFDMTGVTTATVMGITPTGARIYDVATIETDEEGNIINVVSWVIPAALTDTAGNIILTITLADNVGGRITSFEFYVKVRNALYNEDDYIDEDDLEGFRDLLNRTRAALEKMEQMVQQDALPNPYPIRIQLDNVTYEYSGANLVEILRGEVAYLGPVSGTVDITADDSAAAQAKRSAEEAAESAEEAADSYEETRLLINNFQSQIPTATVTKNVATHQSIIVITDKNGTTTATVEDGVVGSSWYAGTDLVGTTTGITGYAGNEGDYYLNTDTGNVYRCTLTGDISTALWDYVLTMGADNFGTIKVGSTNIIANGADVLELEAGNNVTLVPDNTNKKVTIHATGGGGGSSTGDMLKIVYDQNNNGIVDKAETLDDGTDSLTASITELNYVHNVVSPIQAQINGKANSSHTHASADIYDLSIPDELADLTDDSTHRVVTDTQISTWDGKQDTLNAGTGITIDATTNTISATAPSIKGYKRVTVGGTNIDASQAEDSIELIASTGMTITPDAVNKTITFVSSGGGGSSTGDMLKIVYDQNNNGIVDKAQTLNDGTTALTASIAELNYVHDVTSPIQTQLNGKTDTGHTHTKSEITDFPTIPTALTQLDTTGNTNCRVVTDAQISSWNQKQNALQAGAGITISGSQISATGVDTYSPTSHSSMSGIAVASAISSASLDDLADVTITTPASNQVLKYNGTAWVNGTGGGHTMTPEPTVPFVPSQQIPTEEDAIVQAVNLAHTASGEGWANDDVPSLNTISQWSNEKNITIEVHGDTTTIDATGIGDWKEDSELVNPTAQDESGWGWVYVPELIGMGSNHTVDFKLTFDPVACGGPVTLGGYILDDTTGYLCIKFGNEIASPSTAIIGIEVIYKRNGRRVVGS